MLIISASGEITKIKQLVALKDEVRKVKDGQDEGRPPENCLPELV